MKYEIQFGERDDGSAWISIRSDKNYTQFDAPNIETARQICKAFCDREALLESAKAVVSKSYLRGGWKKQQDGTLKAAMQLEDVTVHPDLIEALARAVAKAEGSQCN